MGAAVVGAAGRIAIVLNPHAGGRDHVDTSTRIVELFAARGVDAWLVPWPGGGDLAAAVREAARNAATAVVAGGGDGTVSSVAAALVGTAVPLGVLPLGTLNHFAKDAGIPLDLEKAVATIVEGRSIAIDVGEANGRVFVNNFSVGMYPSIVRSRESLQRQGHSKWLSMLLAAARALRRPHRMRVTIDADGRRSARRAAIVMVGNNAYEVFGRHVAGRPTLTGGRIVLYVAPSLGELQVVPAGRIQIGIAGRATVPVAIDGEVSTTTVPIECRCRPAALNIIVSRS